MIAAWKIIIKLRKPKMGRAAIILERFECHVFWQAQLVILVRGPKI